MKATDWAERAACLNRNPDELFVRGAAQNRAKLICAPCPVRQECLAEALDNRISIGIWGGMTERERRALLRQRPDVTSWRRLLARAPGRGREHDAGGRKPREEVALAEIVTDARRSAGVESFLRRST